MSANNPDLNNVERPAAELPELIARLGRLGATPRLSGEQLQIAQAIQQHASNSIETIMDGIESIGQLMSMAGLNDQYEMGRTHIVNIGQLIAHLSVEAQAMARLESDMQVVAKASRGAV